MIVSGLSSPLPYQSNPSESLDSTRPSSNDPDKKIPDSSHGVNADSEDEKQVSQSTAAEQRELQKLKVIDREVRAHELAHISAGGRYITSAAHFSYQKGPDGRLYAVAGEVGIDTSSIAGDPRATLLKAQTVVRAALAPANPSAQDRNVAAQAAAVIQQARVDLAALLSDASTQDAGQYLDAFV